MAKRIVLRLMGGLGNQLFEYAAARRLSILNDAELVIDDISGFSSDYRYQRFSQIEKFQIKARKARKNERLEPLSKVRRKISILLNSFRSFEKRSYIKQEFIGFDDRILTAKTMDFVILEGYWQSERYFKDIESIIRKELFIAPPNSNENLSMANKIKNRSSVCVHVRFFDKPGELNKGNNVDRSYYEKSISHMEKICPDAHYFLFSDFPEDARKLIPVDSDRVTCVDINEGDESAYADLWLMSLCRHFVIANSTFSWWGAWLSNSSEKTVISPGRIKGTVTEWGFDGLIPSNWIVIE